LSLNVQQQGNGSAPAPNTVFTAR